MPVDDDVTQKTILPVHRKPSYRFSFLSHSIYSTTAPILSIVPKSQLRSVRTDTNKYGQIGRVNLGPYRHVGTVGVRSRVALSCMMGGKIRTTLTEDSTVEDGIPSTQTKRESNRSTSQKGQ